MPDLLVTALTSGAVVALVTAVIQAVTTRKKLSADAARIIEEAASSAVTRMGAENDRLRERLDLVESALGEMRELLRERDDLISDLRRDLDEVRGQLRSRDLQIAELGVELDVLRAYAIKLRDELRRQDPTLVLPTPPDRIARHFYEL